LSSGNIVVDSLDYDRINKFSSGLSLVNKGDLYGYINKSGKIAIDMQYQSAKSFIEKWAIVTKDQKSGIIDTDGKEVIPIIYEKIWLPESNKIRVKLNKKYYYLNLDGSKSNIKGYNKATNFFGNYAIVNNGAQYMLLDKNGKETVLPYKSVSVGGERKWIYSDGNKFGFLNNNGSQLTPLSFDLLMQYKEGRAGFAIDDIWGYLDEEGNIIIAPQYPLAWDFKNNYARIITKTGFGFIKKDGTLILPPKYMELRDFSNGLARIQVYR
ncbi:MAG: WG repeat-containing protein, partial [Saprospiraceae bacterium]